MAQTTVLDHQWKDQSLDPVLLLLYVHPHIEHELVLYHHRANTLLHYPVDCVGCVPISIRRRIQQVALPEYLL